MKISPPLYSNFPNSSNWLIFERFGSFEYMFMSFFFNLSSSAHSNIGFKYYLLWPGLIYSSFSIQCPFYILLIGALHIDRLYWFQINTYLSDNAGPHKLWQPSVAQWVLAKTNITNTPQDLKKSIRHRDKDIGKRKPVLWISYRSSLSHHLFMAWYTLGWSEKHRTWKMQKFRADSEPRHSTDFRTIFGIMIGWFVLLRNWANVIYRKRR